MIKKTNAIQSELYSFAKTILENTAPEVTNSHGYQALKVAYQILCKPENHKANLITEPGLIS